MYECTPSAVAKKFSNEIAEEVMYPIIIPVMSSMMLLLIRVEKNRINPMTTMEPIKAPNTIEKKLERVMPAVANVPPKVSMTTATPRLAPELIPRMEGPANGLLKAV